MARITRRTGRQDRIGGVMTAIFGIVFAVIAFSMSGVGSMFDRTSDMIFDVMGMGFDTPPVFSIAAMGMGVIGLAVAVSGVYMAVKGEGISKETVDVDSNGDPLFQVNIPPAPPAAAASAPKDTDPAPEFEEKLRALNRLLKDGIITQAEYNEKRKQVLDEQW